MKLYIFVDDIVIKNGIVFDIDSEKSSENFRIHFSVEIISPTVTDGEI